MESPEDWSSEELDLMERAELDRLVSEVIVDPKDIPPRILAHARAHAERLAAERDSKR